MRIAVDARPLSVPMFGIGRYTREVLSRLVSNMDGVDWYFYCDRPLPDAEWQKLGKVRAFSSHQRLLSPLRTQFTFAKWAQQDRIETFWSPRHHLPLALSGNVHQVVTIHDLVWQKYPQSMQTANYWLDRLLMPPSVRRAHRILAVSQSTASDLVSSYPDLSGRISVTHLAANQVPLLKADNRGGRYLLFVGTAEPRKNLEGILRAFASIADNIPGFSLVIAGAQGWMEQVADIVRRHSVPRVEVLGHVTDERLQGLYQNATLLLMPSLYEGFGLPALEAMHHGVPVIGANVSSLPEVIGDGGLLVDPHDVPALADAIAKIVNNQSVREDLSSKAKIQAHSFSWSSTAQQTELALRGG